MAVTPHVALFRAVNVGGRKATSVELKALADDLGLKDARTLLQSGNLVFRSARAGAELEAEIERAFVLRFGFATDVLVRGPEEWRATVAANPFAAMAERDPSHLLVVALKSTPAAADVAALSAWIPGRETLAAAGRALFVGYPDGVIASKLTGALIERRLGVRGTARNWNTTTKLAAMLEG
jgi:uncharacterized protein (DUF1697 family)